MNQTVPLSALEEGQEALVGALRADGPIRRRLRDLGLTDGARVVCLQKSPSGDPAAYLIRGAVVALRRQDAGTILMKEVRAHGADSAVHGNRRAFRRAVD